MTINTFDVLDEYRRHYGKVPTKYEVCWQCSGHGTMDCFGRNGVPGEWFDDDPDFASDYASGVYDALCDQCDGKRVVLVIDENQCTAAQIAAWRKIENEAADYAAECAAEARMFGYR